MKLATLYMQKLKLKCLINKIYNKRTGMNIKLKDLLQEQIKVKSDAEVRSNSKTSVRNSSTKKITKKKPKPEEEPEEKETDSCVEVNKYKTQYYEPIGELSGTRAVTYDIWKLYKNGANEISKNFKSESFWADFKGSDWMPILGGDSETDAVNWYWGGYFAKPGGKFYDLVYKQYIQKAVDLTKKYADAVYECGDQYERDFFDLFGTSANPYGKNWSIMRQAWIDGRKKTYGNHINDTLIYKLEHPKGVSTYIVDTDF